MRSKKCDVADTIAISDSPCELVWLQSLVCHFHKRARTSPFMKECSVSISRRGESLSAKLISDAEMMDPESSISGLLVSCSFAEGCPFMVASMLREVVSGKLRTSFVEPNGKR
jgi:hypothetical protein